MNEAVLGTSFIVKVYIGLRELNYVGVNYSFFISCFFMFQENKNFQNKVQNKNSLSYAPLSRGDKMPSSRRHNFYRCGHFINKIMAHS